jgi:hypothetical protein
MIGRAAVLWLTLAVAAGVGLFHVSYRVQSLEEALTQVNRDIQRERETIQVLHAEWSYLNEPSRLAELSRRHLTLAPLLPDQMIRIEDLPLRLPPLIAEAAPLADAEAALRPSSAGTPPASIADLIERTTVQP